MEQEYKIKGIEKILEKISKEDLAKYYGVDINADFERLITESFQKRGIPNNSEIGLYVFLTEKDIMERAKEGLKINPQEIALKFHEQDERKRALYGVNYNIYDILDEKRPTFSLAYFLIDEPIKESALEKIGTQKFVGGVMYNGLIMGKEFYTEHKEELDKHMPSRENMKAVDNYIDNFIKEFEDVEYIGGYGPRPKYQDTAEKREEKAKNEEVILKLTGKNSIDELSLTDFIKLKRSLEEEQKQLQKAFEERFAGKDYEEKE